MKTSTLKAVRISLDIASILLNPVIHRFPLPEAGTEEGLGIAKKNFRDLKQTAWGVMELLYHAQAFGPNHLNGPAMIVFPNKHLTSADPLLLAYLNSYVAPVYKRDTAVPSRLARLVGGVEVRYGKHAFINLRHLKFLLNSSEVVALFPFTDVHDSRPAQLLLRWAVNYDRQHEQSIDYYAGSVVWKRGGKELTSLEKNRVLTSYWPRWRSNTAAILISDRPIKSKGKRLDELVTDISNEARRLRDSYMS